MRANIVTRLDKLKRRLPPGWGDLARLIGAAGEKMTQAEFDAYLAYVRYRATTEQVALYDEWHKRNRTRIWAVWDEKYPGWENAPFWSEQGEAGQSENADDEER